MAKAPQKGSEATDKQNVAPEKSKVDEKTAKPASVESSGPKVPFNRWFVSKRFKSHWRRGMEAFANTSGLRTVEEWDKLFETY